MVGGSGLLLSEGEEVVEGDDADTTVGRLDRLEGSLLDLSGGAIVDEDLERGALANNGRDSSEEVGVREDTVDLGLVDRVLELYTVVPLARAAGLGETQETHSVLSKRIVGGREGDTLGRAGWWERVRTTISSLYQPVVLAKTHRWP